MSYQGLLCLQMCKKKGPPWDKYEKNIMPGHLNIIQNAKIICVYTVCKTVCIQFSSFQNKNRERMGYLANGLASGTVYMETCL